MKESNTIDIAEYAMANQIAEEPAFDWWVKEVLRRKHRLIKTACTRILREGYKFGCRLPNTIDEALKIDEECNNHLWRDAIEKEMKNVKVAFEIMEENSRPPPGYKQIPLRLIFDVKMDLTRKAQLVAGGHKTDPPTTLTYSTVVLRESVRIAFVLAALLGLDIRMCDIGNAYLHATTEEKVYTIAGREFGEYCGRYVKIVQALYGLKSSGASWRRHFAGTMNNLGYKSSLADPDIWMKPAITKDRRQYYEYVLVYVDDIICISEDPLRFMNQLRQVPYPLKGNDMPPTLYLGSTISRYNENGYSCWAMLAQKYLEGAIAIVEERIAPKNLGVADSPFVPTYKPELDGMRELDDKTYTFYLNFIGILQWTVELGRIDIAYATATLSRYSANPRDGHYEALLRVFAYLKKHLSSKIVFDACPRDWSRVEWTGYDWKDYYPDAEEAIPPNMPMPRGEPMQINLFVDALHASDVVTRRSCTGIIIFLNGAPIHWYCKRQLTIETATFGSEFVALKIGMELIEALCYKLQMFGIPVVEPGNTFCDNLSVVNNVSNPTLTLRKRHNSIAYHKVQESVAAGTQCIAFEPGCSNLANMLTKPLAGKKFHDSISHVMTR